MPILFSYFPGRRLRDLSTEISFSNNSKKYIPGFCWVFLVIYVVLNTGFSYKELREIIVV